MKKKFIGFDAEGTDKPQKAIYKVIDDDGFSYPAVKIDVEIHNSGDDLLIDKALLKAIS